VRLENSAAENLVNHVPTSTIGNHARKECALRRAERPLEKVQLGFCGILVVIFVDPLAGIALGLVFPIQPSHLAGYNDFGVPDGFVAGPFGGDLVHPSAFLLADTRPATGARKMAHSFFFARMRFFLVLPNLSLFRGILFF